MCLETFSLKIGQKFQLKLRPKLAFLAQLTWISEFQVTRKCLETFSLKLGHKFQPKQRPKLALLAHSFIGLLDHSLIVLAVVLAVWP